MFPYFALWWLRLFNVIFFRNRTVRSPAHGPQYLYSNFKPLNRTRKIVGLIFMSVTDINFVCIRVVCAPGVSPARPHRYPPRQVTVPFFFYISFIKPPAPSSPQVNSRRRRADLAATLGGNSKLIAAPLAQSPRNRAVECPQTPVQHCGAVS